MVNRPTIIELNKTEKKKEVKNMNEDMKAEVIKSAQYIGLSEEEALAKFVEVCEENGIETTNPIAKGVWRNYVANVRRTKRYDGVEQNESKRRVYA